MKISLPTFCCCWHWHCCCCCCHSQSGIASGELLKRSCTLKKSRSQKRPLKQVASKKSCSSSSSSSHLQPPAPCASLPGPSAGPLRGRLPASATRRVLSSPERWSPSPAWPAALSGRPSPGAAGRSRCRTSPAAGSSSGEAALESEEEEDAEAQLLLLGCPSSTERELVDEDPGCTLW